MKSQLISSRPELSLQEIKLDRLRWCGREVSIPWTSPTHPQRTRTNLVTSETASLIYTCNRITWCGPSLKTRFQVCTPANFNNACRPSVCPKSWPARGLSVYWFNERAKHALDGRSLAMDLISTSSTPSIFLGQIVNIKHTANFLWMTIHRSKWSHHFASMKYVYLIGDVLQI